MLSNTSTSTTVTVRARAYVLFFKINDSNLIEDVDFHRCIPAKILRWIFITCFIVIALVSITFLLIKYKKKDSIFSILKDGMLIT